MLSWLRRCSLSLLFGALLLALGALFPSRAYAGWNNWNDGYKYCISGTTLPSSFKTTVTQSGAGGYGNLIAGSYYIPNSNSYTGPVWNTKPSASFLIVKVYFCNSSDFKEGNRVRYEGRQVITYSYSTGTPAGTYDYRDSTLQYSDLRYFCSKSGNTDRVELTPNSDGTMTLPYDCSYFFVVQTVTTTPVNSTYWYVYSSGNLYSYYPDSTDTVTAIENQTDDLMSTEGADTGIEGYEGQAQDVFEGLQPVQVLEDMTTEITSTISTQETDTTVRFPGLEMAGFTLPAYNVDVMELCPEDLREPIRMMVTLVFVVAFLRHMWNLIDMIFGIHDYGSGAADFGDGNPIGYTVKNWRPDYSIDEDLGF